MKISATIQARLSSERLPGKVLKDMAGKPLLQQHVERIQRSRLVDEVIIATTTNPKDDAIEKLAQKLAIKCFRGSENDVLGRMAALMRAHSVEVHLEFFGDSPLTDPQLIDEVTGYFLKHQGEYDYVSNAIECTYPSGMEVGIYLGKTLLEAEALVRPDDPLREHVSIHIYKNPKFRCKNLAAPEYFHRPDVYLEVDTETDYRMLQAIFEHFKGQSQKHFSLSQILDFLNERPDLAKLNQNEHRRWKTVKNS